MIVQNAVNWHISNDEGSIAVLRSIDATCSNSCISYRCVICDTTKVTCHDITAQ